MSSMRERLDALANDAHRERTGRPMPEVGGRCERCHARHARLVVVDPATGRQTRECGPCSMRLRPIGE